LGVVGSSHCRYRAHRRYLVNDPQLAQKEGFIANRINIVKTK